MIYAVNLGGFPSFMSKNSLDRSFWYIGMVHDRCSEMAKSMKAEILHPCLLAQGFHDSLSVDVWPFLFLPCLIAPVRLPEYPGQVLASFPIPPRQDLIKLFGHGNFTRSPVSTPFLPGIESYGQVLQVNIIPGELIYFAHPAEGLLDYPKVILYIRISGQDDFQHILFWRDILLSTSKRGDGSCSSSSRFS
jgi:hypothetical protein